MEAGEVLELGTPMELFEKKDGAFRSMCQESGIGKAEIEEAGRRQERERRAAKNRKSTL